MDASIQNNVRRGEGMLSLQNKLSLPRIWAERRGKTPQILADGEHDCLLLDDQELTPCITDLQPEDITREGKGFAAPRLFGAFAPPLYATTGVRHR